MSNEENLPAEITDEDMRSAGFPDGMRMAPGLAVFFNPRMYHQAKACALRLSEASGIVGKHLIGKPSACLAIVSRSITWNLDPFAVAQSTYETPGGKVGYEGKLVQAILENSGAVQGRISFEHKGPWEKLRGKFKMERSRKPGSDATFAVATYTEEDEECLSVVVRCQVKGESEPREEEFWLREMQPRNSTLWATRPRQQICYAAVRAFASIAAPGLLMGIAFDVDPGGFYAGTDMEDVGGSTTTTPARPARPGSAFARTEPEPAAVTSQGEPTEDGDGNSEDGPQNPGPDEPASEAQAEATETANTAKVEETPLARGKRLLLLVRTINDLSDLRLSILEEILDDDAAVAAWHMACDDRGRELTTGEKVTEPKPAAKTKAEGKKGGK